MLQISDADRQELMETGRLHQLDGQELLAGLGFDESVFYLTFRSAAAQAKMAGTRSERHFERLDLRHREALQQRSQCADCERLAIPAIVAL
jgi:hypothetical protein